MQALHSMPQLLELFSTLDKDSEEILKKKFELAFFFAKKT